MPTTENNQLVWGETYDWIKQGDEWSEPWGGAEAQWFGSILPRIHAFVPTGTILEIAPGFGRWTQFLKEHCERLIVVDLNENCIRNCQARFASDSHITYHVNDGKSLEMIPDGALDFVFSFDSLVHAEAPVLETYLRQLANKLKPDGVGFIHHSNIGEYHSRWALKSKLPFNLDKTLMRKGFFNDHHWRAFSMTASLFEKQCDDAGLQCIGQELVNWRGQLPIDAFSLFTRRDSKWSRPNRVFMNRNFMKEAASISRISQLYSASHFSKDAEHLT